MAHAVCFSITAGHSFVGLAEFAHQSNQRAAIAEISSNFFSALCTLNLFEKRKFLMIIPLQEKLMQKIYSLLKKFSKGTSINVKIVE